MTTETAKKPSGTIGMRILSAAILAPLVLGTMYMGGLVFEGIMAFAAVIGSYEFARMVLSEAHNRPRFLRSLLALSSGFAVAVSGWFSSPVASLAPLMMAFSFVLLFNLVRRGPSLWKAMTGVAYITFAIASMVWLRAGEGMDGFYHLLVLLLIVWASDTGAYFTGKTFGGPKLAPTISPKKTWSGFAGSSLFAGLAAAFMAKPDVVSSFETATLGGLSIGGYFCVGFVLAMFGQVGDLLISMVKRRYGVKDTGALIPGHGGILDRIDALIFVAVIYASIAKYAGYLY